MSEDSKKMRENKKAPKKTNFERLIHDIYIILENEPFLDKINSLIAVLAQGIYISYDPKVRPLMIKKINENLLKYMSNYEENGSIFAAPAEEGFIIDVGNSKDRDDT